MPFALPFNASNITYQLDWFDPGRSLSLSVLANNVFAEDNKTNSKINPNLIGFWQTELSGITTYAYIHPTGEIQVYSSILSEDKTRIVSLYTGNFGQIVIPENTTQDAFKVNQLNQNFYYWVLEPYLPSVILPELNFTELDGQYNSKNQSIVLTIHSSLRSVDLSFKKLTSATNPETSQMSTMFSQLDELDQNIIKATIVLHNADKVKLDKEIEFFKKNVCKRYKLDSASISQQNGIESNAENTQSYDNTSLNSLKDTSNEWILDFQKTTINQCTLVGKKIKINFVINNDQFSATFNPINSDSDHTYNLKIKNEGLVTLSLDMDEYKNIKKITLTYHNVAYKDQNFIKRATYSLNLTPESVLTDEEKSAIQNLFK